MWMRFKVRRYHLSFSRRIIGYSSKAVAMRVLPSKISNLESSLSAAPY